MADLTSLFAHIFTNNPIIKSTTFDSITASMSSFASCLNPVISCSRAEMPMTAAHISATTCTLSLITPSSRMYPLCTILHSRHLNLFLCGNGRVVVVAGFDVDCDVVDAWVCCSYHIRKHNWDKYLYMLYHTGSLYHTHTTLYNIPGCKYRGSRKLQTRSTVQLRWKWFCSALYFA